MFQRELKAQVSLFTLISAFWQSEKHSTWDLFWVVEWFGLKSSKLRWLSLLEDHKLRNQCGPSLDSLVGLDVLYQTFLRELLCWPPLTKKGQIKQGGVDCWTWTCFSGLKILSLQGSNTAESLFWTDFYCTNICFLAWQGVFGNQVGPGLPTLLFAGP